MKITITRREGPVAECGKPVVVDSWLGANSALGNIGRNAPETGGYDKTDFCIVFDNGDLYAGRVDVQRDHAWGGYNLEGHVRTHLKYVASNHSGQFPAEVIAEASAMLDKHFPVLQ